MAPDQFVVQLGRPVYQAHGGITADCPPENMQSAADAQQTKGMLPYSHKEWKAFLMNIISSWHPLAHCLTYITSGPLVCILGRNSGILGEDVAKD